MNILDKVGNGVARSIDTIIDKNRQYAQLNRLNAVIRSETETLNRAYIALGKQYHKILEGSSEEVDMSHICAVIESAKIRLKKAQARYDYIEKYGLPKKNTKQVVTKISSEDEIKTEIDTCDDEEDDDITIAYADTVSSPQENAADNTKPVTEIITESLPELVAEKTETIGKTEIKPELPVLSEPVTPVKNTVIEPAPTAEEKADTIVAELKKKRSASYARKKAADISDAEVANDSDITPTV